MIKYVPKMTSVVLEEIPDRVSLAVDISNCRGNCVGCHSPFLKLDIGEELTPAIVDALIADNFGVNCFLFLGEGRDPEALLALAAHIRSAHPAMEIALYSGREEVEPAIWDAFDYVKVGPYRPECGPLNERSTNQRLYHVRRTAGAACPPGTCPPPDTGRGRGPSPAMGGAGVKDGKAVRTEFPGGHAVPDKADEGLRTGNARTGFPSWDTAGPFARRGWQDASSAIPSCAEDITFRFWRKGIDPNR